MTGTEANSDSRVDEVVCKLKPLVARHLNLNIDPASIDANEEYFLDRHGFNSIDALELLIVLEKEFGIEIDDEDLDARLFRTLGVLARYIVSAQRHQA